MKDHKALTLIISIIFIFLILAVVPFMAAYAQPAIKPTGELRIGLPTLHTETFHPFWGIQARKAYYEPLYDYLIGVDVEGKPSPEESIAYKWEESPDHLTWTFWIRDGVTFHDGTPLTVEDVKYSLEELLNPKNFYSGTVHKAYQDRVEIIPPNKVRVHLKKPWPLQLYFLSPCNPEASGVILPKKYLGRVSEKDYDKHPIGSGPYKFLEMKEGNYIKYVAQDHHWRVGTPKYKYLTFKKLPEEGTREAALRSREMDLIQVGINRVNKLEADGFVIHEMKDAVNLFLDFLRTYEPGNPLGKKEVRQALVYSIDKAEILQHVLMGRGTVIGYVYNIFSWSISYKEYPLTPYDPKKAKQLLSEAGYPNGFTIYLYSYVTSIPEQKLINEAIAGYWEAIGMDVKILAMDASAFFMIWTKKKEPPGPAAFVHSWSSRPMNPWAIHYHSDVAHYLFSQIKDPVMDRLIGEYEAAIKLDKFIEAERTCEDRALEMFYKSGLFATGSFFVSRKDVPKSNLGRNIDSYRFEYIGATK